MVEVAGYCCQERLAKGRKVAVPAHLSEKTVVDRVVEHTRLLSQMRSLAVVQAVAQYRLLRLDVSSRPATSAVVQEAPRMLVEPRG